MPNPTRAISVGVAAARAVQLLLGHQKIESTVRYLGIDIDDALTISEQIDI
jgi:site-specific recombinase XerD